MPQHYRLQHWAISPPVSKRLIGWSRGFQSGSLTGSTRAIPLITVFTSLGHVIDWPPQSLLQPLPVSITSHDETAWYGYAQYIVQQPEPNNIHSLFWRLSPWTQYLTRSRWVIEQILWPHSVNTVKTMLVKHRKSLHICSHRPCFCSM